MLKPIIIEELILLQNTFFWQGQTWFFAISALILSFISHQILFFVSFPTTRISCRWNTPRGVKETEKESHFFLFFKFWFFWECLIWPKGSDLFNLTIVANRELRYLILEKEFFFHISDEKCRKELNWKNVPARVWINWT